MADDLSWLTWHRSRSANHTTGIEIAFADSAVFIRAAHDPTHVLEFTRDEWRAFTDGVNAGEFRFGGAA